MTKPAEQREETWDTQHERGNMFALKLMTWIALHFGRRLSRLVLVPIVAYFFISSPKARQASQDYLQRAGGQSVGKRSVFKHLYTFAAVTLDRIYLLNGRLDLFDIQIKDVNNQALNTASSGAGLILMGAHFGSFESVRCIARDHSNLKMALLMYEENAQNIKRLLHAINPSMQQEIISLGQPRAMLKVNERLNEGALVGVLADRFFGDAESVEVVFLGKKTNFPTGPFRMAAMLNHPVYFMAGIYHGGNRYTINFDPIINLARDGSHVQNSAQVAALRYIELLENHCKANPFNWFNFYDFWEKEEIQT